MILVLILPCASVSAIVGNITGQLAALTTKSILGSVIRIAISLPVASLYVAWFISAVEPRENIIAQSVHTFVTRACSGAIVTIFARSTVGDTKKIQFALSDVLSYCAIFDVLCE